MSHDSIAAQLAAVPDASDFVTAAIAVARAHGIGLPAASLQQALMPDVLGLSRWSAAPLTGTALPPRDWLPINLLAEAQAIVVDWAKLGAGPLRESFYEDSIRRALISPFNRAFRYRTRLDDIVRQTNAEDCLMPDGFIFHMSRCGSTLVAQMLAAVPDNIVISEAAPLDAIVQLARHLPEETAIAALRAMIAVFGRKRGGREQHYFIKLDFWHPLALPLFRKAFPDVPWIFLYRDPTEVLVSQIRQRGMQMVPQFIPPSVYGIDPADCSLDEEYCARVLAAVCRAAIEHAGLQGGLFLNYRELPDAVFTKILAHFAVSFGEAEIAQMREAAKRDAKSPYQSFAGDADDKRKAPTDAVRHAADRYLGEIYPRLERLAAASGPRIRASA